MISDKKQITEGQTLGFSKNESILEGLWEFPVSEFKQKPQVKYCKEFHSCV